jgi:orotate phosphoribosyltransferase
MLQDQGVLVYGDFILRNGESSNYYCDIKQALGNPKIVKKMIDALLPLIPQKATCIAGSGYGGISLASLIAYKKKLPLVLVRDKVKDHGTKKIIDGYVPNKKDIVCIIDDVFTTGSSIADTKEKLRPLGVVFTKPVVVLNRSKSKSVVFLISDKDIR